MNVTGQRHKLGDRPPAPRTPFWKCRGCSARVPLRVMSQQRPGAVPRVVKTGRCPKCGRHREMTPSERVLIEGGYSAEFRREFPPTLGLIYHFANKKYRHRRGFVPRDDIIGPMMVRACYAAMTYYALEVQFSTYLSTCLNQKEDRDIYVPEKHLSMSEGLFDERNEGSGFEKEEADRNHDDERARTEVHETLAMLLYRANLGKSRSQVLRWRYGMDGEKLTLEEIGRRMKFSKERARQLEISAVERLRKMAEQEGMVGRLLAS